MELTLNLVWALLSGAMVCLWLCFGPAEGHGRRLQVVALAVLILIVFPVISVSDDLFALQNPAEVDGSQRRDHVAQSAHSIFPAHVTLPLPAVAEIPFAFLRLAAPGNPPLQIQEHPGLAAIENRPPPAA
jgi:hypothetical protein